MHPKSLKLLDDIVDAAVSILDCTSTVTLPDYQTNRLLKSAVERNFEIIGEALLRLEQYDRPTVERISDYRKVIGFRNRLAHGYDAIDQAVVWGIIMSSLPTLLVEVHALRAQKQQ